MYKISTSNIVFFQQDDDTILDGEEGVAYQPWAAIYDFDGLTMHIPTDESIVTAAQILAQWDYGDEPHEVKDLDPWMVDHDRWFIRPDRDENDWIVFTEDWSVHSATGFHDGYVPEPGDYVLTAHRHLGYTVLDRIEDVQSCEGHADGPSMGETFYCDGTCLR